jgi:hypothetical protein
MKGQLVRSVEQRDAAAHVLLQQATRHVNAHDAGAGDHKIECGTGTHERL